MRSTEADASDIARAIERLAADDLVAFPTETSWGLAASARSEEAVDRLRAFKGRDPNQAISVIVSAREQVPSLGCAVSPLASVWMDGFWPGPLTLVLPCAAGGTALVRGVANDRGGLGLRCSPHPVASALARAAEQAGIGPLTATSCNESGSPAAQSRSEAQRVCGTGDSAPYVLASGADASGELASTVVDLQGGVRVLRAGAITKQRLRDIAARGGLPLAPGDLL